MNFFDTTMSDQPLPYQWFDYDAHLEVRSIDIKLQEYLKSHGWEHFADGGETICKQDIIDQAYVTHWYGLKRSAYEGK